MLRIGELYSAWMHEWAEDLDDRFQDGPMPDDDDVGQLIRSPHFIRNTSGALRNARIATWGRFILWAGTVRNWCHVHRESPEYAREARAKRKQSAEEIWHALNEQRESLALCTRQNASLRVDELEAIEDYLLAQVRSARSKPRSNSSPGGKWACDHVAIRNWLLYGFQRYAGLRVGEVLKLRQQDLTEQSQECALDELLAGRERSYLAIRRRPADPDDPRRRGAVKRENRTIPVSTTLASQAWRYRDLFTEVVRDTVPYLLVSERNRPLSMSRAEQIAQDVSRGATAHFARMYPGRSHTLTEFRWHRLRHTRATEVVPIFFPNGRSSPEQLVRFLAYFGWNSERSAWPYLTGLDSSAAEEMLRIDEARLRQATPMRSWTRREVQP